MGPLWTRFLTAGEVSNCWQSSRTALAHVWCRLIVSIVRWCCRCEQYEKRIMTLDNKDDDGQPINEEACKKGWKWFTVVQEKASLSIRRLACLMEQPDMTRRQGCEVWGVRSPSTWYPLAYSEKGQLASTSNLIASFLCHNFLQILRISSIAILSNVIFIITNMITKISEHSRSNHCV